MFISKREMELMNDAPPHKDLVDRYIATLDREPTTVKAYNGALRRYLNYLDSIGVDKPTDVEVIQYKKHLKEEEITVNGVKKKRGSASIQRTVVVLHKFYQWCGDDHDYYPNIARCLHGEKIKSEFRRGHLTMDQAFRLIDKANELKEDSINALRDCVLVNMLLFTGMRTIEACRANKSDIYKSTINDRTYLSIQGKGRDEKDEAVLLSDTMVELINEYLNKRNDKYEPLFVEHAKNRKGGRLTTTTISKIIKKLLQHIGINSREVTAHSLRHTFATIAKELGIPMDELQARMRHKSSDTTKRYDHYGERENSTVELKVEEAIRKRMKK